MVASQNSQRCYDDAMLSMLDEALIDVWQVLKAHGSYPEWGTAPELKNALAKKIRALADSGIRDRQELRSRTLQSLPLGRPGALRP
jgi:hypothetical protein